MKKTCSNCKWLDSEDYLQPCPICNSNYDMFEAVDIKYGTVEEIDIDGVKALLFALNEAITGFEWKVENDPISLGKSDYEKLDEWTKTLKNYPLEFWTDKMRE